MVTSSRTNGSCEVFGFASFPDRELCGCCHELPHVDSDLAKKPLACFCA